MSNVKIIAEIGCNHNGSFELAKKMMHSAKECGADAVKFQVFDPDSLASTNAPKANYQKKNDFSNNHLEMLRNLKLNNEDYIKLIKYAEDLDIEIFATAFDMKSIKFLSKLGQNIWKIPSGEIDNLPYLELISNLECDNKTIIISTGMCNFEDINFAIEILNAKKNVYILQCNTQYPTQPEDMNLNVLKSYLSLYPNFKVGLSDHSEGFIASILSVAMGASMIEKHFTIDSGLPGPDQSMSIEPSEFKKLCDNIRISERMLGTRIKKISDSEKENIAISRKSIVASSDIKQGEKFTEKNITCKRPGNGISPKLWYDLIGRVAHKDYCYDDIISKKELLL